MNHFALDYAKQVNQILHDVLWPTWFYKYEILQVEGIVTAILITYDNQKDDEFIIEQDMIWESFIQRMTRVKEDWIDLSKEVMLKLSEHPEKTMGGWEGRTIYIIKGGNNPEFWTIEKAQEDISLLLSSSFNAHGSLVQYSIQNIRESIPVGEKHFRLYENQIRIVINYLFINHLGIATFQDRTESEREGTDIRDLICHNNAEGGFWHDLKVKYSCSEIVFEVKNKTEINRNDLRQLYCYLKPVLGFWGFIVCREEQPEKIHAYNRTLFKNFAQQRGVLILDDIDLQKMVEIKMHQREPSDYLSEKMSKFIRSI